MTAADFRINVEGVLRHFEKLDTDDQLVVLWLLFDKLGQAIKAAAPVAVFSQSVQRMLSLIITIQRNDQLDAVRDIAIGAETRIHAEYATLNPNMKLAFWYRLANEMRQGTVQPIPADIPVSAMAQKVLESLDSFGFNQKVTFLQRAVAKLGTVEATV